MTMPTHELLLALAGHVDDDLLTWARELAAVGEEGRGTELLTAALVADRVALPPDVRAALVAAGRAARTVLDVDGILPPPRADGPTSHVFDPALGPGGVGEVVRRALDELVTVASRSWLTWRSTPAGSASGPLPQPVVLVELGNGTATGSAVLTHQLATALERAGVAAAVEVFGAGTTLPGYHRAALRTALRVHGGTTSALFAPPAGPVDTALPLDPPEPAGTTDEPGPVEDPERSPTPVSAVVSAWWAAAAIAEPEPVEPAEIREAPLPFVRPTETGPPAAQPVLDLPGEPLVPVAEPAAVDAGPPPRPRAAALADDPLNGPLREPLLAPLLDPSVDEPPVGGLFTSHTAGTGGFDPVVPQPAHSLHQDDVDEPPPVRAATWVDATAAADARPQPQVWPDSVPARVDLPPPQQGGLTPIRLEQGHLAAGPPPSWRATVRAEYPSRTWTEPPSGQYPVRRDGGPPAAPRDIPALLEPEPATPLHGLNLVDPRLGLRPDSLDRLSPPDRALLARLQQELRRPTPARRPAPRPDRPERPRLQPRPRPFPSEPPDIAG